MGGGRQLRAAPEPDRGYMLCPGKAGKTMGASFGNATEGASLPARRPVRIWPASLVSQCSGQGNAGSGSDHFNCGAAGSARARDTARNRRRARPSGGAELAAGARSGREREPERFREDRRWAGTTGKKRPGERAPPPSRPQGLVEADVPTPLLWGGRRRFRASCVTSVCTAALTSVCRCKFKNCHWPGVVLPPPHSETEATAEQ